MILLLTLGVAGLAAAGLLAWVLTARARRGAHSRLQAGAWAAFVSRCPEPPPDSGGASHPLIPHPGPSGEVVVRRDGLCLRLDTHPGRTLWLPWTVVRRLSPAESSGVEISLAGGLRFHVSALAGRDIWEAETASLRSGASSGPPALAPVAG